MKLSKKIASKLPEKHVRRASKTYRVIKGIINIVCWLVIIVLAGAMIIALVSRVNGGTPSLFGYTFHRVSSGSMEPTLKVGDVILDKEISDISQVKEGDIITFQGGAHYDNNLVTHRVVRAPYTENGVVLLQTKGDANDVEDKPITAKDVRSIFVTKINFLAKLYSFFLSPWGLITFIAVLLIIFFDEIINIVKVVSGYYDNEDEENISDIIERIQKEDATENDKNNRENEENKDKE